MKALATGLLVVAAILFVISSGLEESHPAWGYVRATAEAAMVGALADWFAVNALFKHPLGLPVPHTAIVPERQGEIADGLATFVSNNFLAGEVVGEKLEGAELAKTFGQWLAKPENASSLIDDVVLAAQVISRKMGEDEVVKIVVEKVFFDRLGEHGKQLEAEVQEYEQLHGWTKEVFASVERGLGEAVQPVDTKVRQQLEAELAGLADALTHNKELQARVDPWIVSAVTHLADAGRGQVGALISQTVRDWDPDELVDLIEPKVGRDLQFVRINGTLVGGLVGLLLFVASELFF